MKSVYLHKRKYLKFATLKQGTEFAVFAFLVIEEGGEIVFISEPRFIRYVKNTTPLLPGEISSPFLIGGAHATTAPSEAVLSPYSDYFNSKSGEFNIYSPRAPTSR